MLGVLTGANREESNEKIYRVGDRLRCGDFKKRMTKQSVFYHCGSMTSFTTWVSYMAVLVLVLVYIPSWGKMISAATNYFLDTYLGQTPLASWEQLIQNDAFAKRAREDVEDVLKKLHDRQPQVQRKLYSLSGSVHGATLIEGS